MTPPRWLYQFDEPLPASCDPAAVCGGKGAVLRTLAAARLPTPPGFTITTDACRAYFAHGRQWPQGLAEQIQTAVGALERAVAQSFAAPPRPLLLAVRSGAPVSLPGMLLTLLNVGLTRQLAEVLDRPAIWSAYAELVRDLSAARGIERSAERRFDASGDARAECLQLLDRCERTCGEPFPQDPWDLLSLGVSAVFDSWASDRAVAYRRWRQLDDSSGTAVTVQAMIATEAAGVLFSHDPRQPQGDALVIEAVRGSGASLVAGHVTPQRYEAARQTPGIAQASPPRESILNAAQLADLSSLALQVESLLGGPVDVEWGCAAGRVWLFQARPLAPPPGREPTAELWAEERQRLQHSARRHGTRRWVRHNLGETLPAPTPLTWDLVRRWMSGRGGYGRMYRSLGYAPSRRVCEDGFLELVAGRICADPDRLAEVFCAGLPLGYDLAALEADPRRLDSGPTVLVPERAAPWLLFRLPGLLWRMWRAGRCVRRESRCVEERFEQHVLPPYRSWVQQQRHLDLSRLSARELAELLEARCARVLDDFAAESLRLAFFAGRAMQTLESRLVRLLGPHEGSRAARDLILGLVAPGEASGEVVLYRIGQGQASVAEFLDQFGHRGPDEMELAAPRWREMPDQVERLAAWLRDSQAPDPAALRQRAAEQRQHAWNELPDRLARHGASAFTEVVQQEARRAQQLLPYRELARHAFLLGYELIRQVVKEIGGRRGLGDDIFFLTYDELGSTDACGLPFSGTGLLSDRLRQRRERWQRLQRVSVPEVIDPDGLDTLGCLPAQAAAGAALDALAVSAGTARGPVRIWTPAKSRQDLPAGSVLVCPALDTGLTPLLLRAAAVVVERGGLLSHGALVARQLGIPAIVLPDAIQRLHDGQMVVVDGDRGRLLAEGGSPP